MGGRTCIPRPIDPGRPPPASSAEALQRMKRTGRRDTAPERAIRRSLYAMGFRYRIDAAPLSGMRSRADILFRSRRVAVFVDGCFWHACPLHATWPKENAGFWARKLAANVARDRSIDAELADAGWTVIRVWEHENPGCAAERIAAVLRGR